MNTQTDNENEPCKIIIIGLPYSGKKTVAKFLAEKYKCKLLDAKDADQTIEYHKAIGNLCFDNYKEKQVLVLQKCNKQTLNHLKKRNFVNVILVDAPFKQRLHFYCKFNNKQHNLQIFQEFSNIDQQSHNQDFYECQEFVRVRILNDKGIAELYGNIATNKDDIIRPFRPNYDQYFMKIADIAKRRSNCMKSSVGCVIVNDNNRVVSTGYNGTPRGLLSCYKEGCGRCNNNIERGLDQCLCLHGEESAILEVGISKTAGCKLYTTLYPCFSCAKIIKQAGIKKIYYMTQYLKPDNGEKFLKQNYQQQDIVQVKVSNIYY